MVNNSTNINKTNNHFSPQSIEHKKTTTYGIDNLGPGNGHDQCGGVKSVNVIQTFLCLWGKFSRKVISPVNLFHRIYTSKLSGEIFSNIKIV
jgi:hypothetical protein